MTAATALPVTEAEWQQQVIDLAHAYRWQHCHVRRTRGRNSGWVTGTSVTGWPDLMLWSEFRKRLIFVELKSETGKVRPEQERVLASLAAAGQEVFVWRPSDLEAAHAELRRAG